MKQELIKMKRFLGGIIIICSILLSAPWLSIPGNVLAQDGPSAEPTEAPPDAPPDGETPPVDPTPEPTEIPLVEPDDLEDLTILKEADLGHAQIVVDINLYGDGWPSDLAVFNNNLYFAAEGSDGKGRELWVYNGTSAPSLVKDIRPGSDSSNPEYLTVFKNKLYFKANGGDGKGYELWVYNGTNAKLVVDLYPGSDGSNPSYLKVFNNKLYFGANAGGPAKQELWVYDGTNPPSRVADINPSGASWPRYLEVFNSKLYFSAYGGDGKGHELWVYDGTNSPSRVADIWPGGGGSYPRDLAVYKSKLYFSADGNDGAGRELWMYNGVNKPSRVADIYTGSESSLPMFMTVYNNKLYFHANGNDNAGEELWMYNGSNPPKRAADIYSGQYGGDPGFLCVFNNKLYFSAFSPGAGYELWSFSEYTTVTYYSVGTYDGWVLESGENSGVGGSMNSSDVQVIVGDDGQDRQYRSILHFDTSSIPDTAHIAAIALKIREHSIVGTNPFTTHGDILIDLKLGAFSESNTLQNGDFQATASKNSAAKIKNAPVSSWYQVNFSLYAFPYFNATGVTQIRLRFQTDDNDDMSADFIRFYSGNFGTESTRPNLIFKYYLD